MSNDIFSQLGVTKEQVDAVEPEEVYEGSLVPSGVYNATVEKVYIRKTDSGAKMAEIIFNLGGENTLHWSGCVASGDEKGNKSTWTVKETHADSVKTRYGVGTEVNLPDVDNFIKFCEATGDKSPDASEGQVEHGDSVITALVMPGMSGKKLKIGVHQYESEYQGDVITKNDIKYWMSADGTNSKGEELEEKAVKNLEKSPIKKLKQKAASTGAASATSGEVPKGWG